MPVGLSGDTLSRRGHTKLLVLLGLLVAVIAVGVFTDIPTQFNNLNASIDLLGFWGPVLFVAVYSTAAVFFIPASVLTLAAGAKFGLVLGTVYVSMASTLAATVSFLIGRYLARDWVAKKINGSPRFAAMDRAVAEAGWKIVALTRLSPVFGFALVNYGYGLTKVKLREYVLASWLCMLPGTIAYVYVGVIGKAATEAGSRSAGEWIISTIGVAATFAVTIYVTKLARRALKKRLEEDTEQEEAPETVVTAA